VATPLAKFWNYVVWDMVEVNFNDTRGMEIGGAESGKTIKTIEFLGDDTNDYAKWGPSFSFSTLVERDEYVRCWNIIRRGGLKFVLLRGTKGIGKSVFIYWLIYKLVQAARASADMLSSADPSDCTVQPSLKPSAGEASLSSAKPLVTLKLPTFLLITTGSEGGKLYQLMSVVDGAPVVHRVRSDVTADYVLSDVEYDVAAHANNWNLNVVSYGTSREPDHFRNVALDAETVITFLLTFLF
jgi:hypothetical protein